jgi:hypothetical protein
MARDSVTNANTKGMPIVMPRIPISAKMVIRLGSDPQKFTRPPVQGRTHDGDHPEWVELSPDPLAGEAPKGVP